MLGGPEYIDVMRTQGERLLETGKQTAQGFRFMNKYGDQGPYNPAAGSLFEGLYSDIYLYSLDRRDLETLRKASSPGVQERRQNPVWRYEYEDGRYEGGNEVAWIDFLEGNDPDYPVHALRDAFARIRLNMQAIAADRSTPDTRQADTPHVLRASKQGPLGAVGAVTGALVNLTLGGSEPLWGGGLLNTELRYFDPVERRPGLPQDVAALVTRIAPDHVVVTLVNVGQTESRSLIVQTGAYGEHICERVAVGNQTVSIGGKSFAVRLEPGAGAELAIYRKRFAGRPTFDFPW